MRTEEQSAALRIIGKFYDAEAAYLQAGGGDFSGIAATLDAECVIFQPASLPYGGEWLGHDGFEAWMKAFVLQWSAMEVADSEFYVDGDVVVSKSRVFATDRQSGRRIGWPLLQIFRMRNGRILELSPFYWDTATLIQNLKG